MPTWQVQLPIAGRAVLEVDADTEEEAIEAALDKVTIDHIEEWEALEHINQGNVCYAPFWDAEVEMYEEEG